MSTDARVCQWRIGYWKDCPDNFHPIGQNFFIAMTVLWILANFFVGGMFLYFSRFVAQGAKDVVVKKIRTLTIISKVAFCVSVPMIAVRMIFGLDGRGFGAPRIILELLFGVPMIGAFICASTMSLIWTELKAIYEKKIPQDKGF